MSSENRQSQSQNQQEHQQSSNGVEGDSSTSRHQIAARRRNRFIFNTIVSDVLASSELARVRLEIGSAMISGDEFESAEEKIQRMVKFKEFVTEKARYDSFFLWPVGLKQKPREMSRAGFFYWNSQADRVICFSCGVMVNGWKEFHDPWERHIESNQSCDFVKMMMGQDYIKSKISRSWRDRDTLYEEVVVAATSAAAAAAVAAAVADGTVVYTSKSELVSEAIENSQLEAWENEQDGSKLCKICLDKEYDVILIPCAHIVCCTSCSFNVTTCPTCRKPFNNVMRIYFS